MLLLFIKELGKIKFFTSTFDVKAYLAYRANSGHYYAYVKYQNEWYHLNDDRARKVTPEVVAKAKAYLLFYRQQGAGDSTEAPEHDAPVPGLVP